MLKRILAVYTVLIFVLFNQIMIIEAEELEIMSSEEMEEIIKEMEKSDLPAQYKDMMKNLMSEDTHEIIKEMEKIRTNEVDFESQGREMLKQYQKLMNRTMNENNSLEKKTLMNSTTNYYALFDDDIKDIENKEGDFDSLYAGRWMGQVKGNIHIESPVYKEQAEYEIDLDFQVDKRSGSITGNSNIKVVSYSVKTKDPAVIFRWDLVPKKIRSNISGHFNTKKKMLYIRLHSGKKIKREGAIVVEGDSFPLFGPYKDFSPRYMLLEYQGTHEGTYITLYKVIQGPTFGINFKGAIHRALGYVKEDDEEIEEEVTEKEDVEYEEYLDFFENVLEAINLILGNVLKMSEHFYELFQQYPDERKVEKQERPLGKEFTDIFEGKIGLKVGLEIEFDHFGLNGGVGGGLELITKKFEHSEVSTVMEGDIGVFFGIGDSKLGFKREVEIPIVEGIPRPKDASFYSLFGSEEKLGGWGKLESKTDGKLGYETTLGIVELGGGINLKELIDFGLKMEKEK
ncbi:MAG: hypothetical protein ACETWK_05610 [Candidatus Aminicenantaceae bacterium]